MQRLVLGTAQFGLNYGVTNCKGRLHDMDLAAIMGLALERGVRNVDTALDYGDAHVRLRPWTHHLLITTKVNGRHPERIPALVERSLRELGVEHLDSVLIHDWHALDCEVRTQALMTLGALRERGIIGRIGASCYAEKDLAPALEAVGRPLTREWPHREVGLDAVQVPANVLDRRLDSSPSILGLVQNGVEIQVRSVLLQGLLARRSEAQPGLHSAVRAFLQHCDRRGIPPLTVALGHARALTWATGIVVGVTSVDEMEQVLAAWESCPAELASVDLATEDLGVIDPRTWPQP